MKLQNVNILVPSIVIFHVKVLDSPCEIVSGVAWKLITGLG